MAEDKNEKKKEEEPKIEEKAEKKERNEEEDDNYKEKYLRALAEFDNYKKRTRLESESARQIGMAELMKDMLPVLDEFEIALIAIRKSEDKQMVKGIELLYSNFVDALRKRGLTEVETTGTYDPYKHEIMLMQIDEKKKPGTILEVTKKGYRFGEILLRPASVIVTKEQDDTENEK